MQIKKQILLLTLVLLLSLSLFGCGTKTEKPETTAKSDTSASEKEDEEPIKSADKEEEPKDKEEEVSKVEEQPADKPEVTVPEGRKAAETGNISFTYGEDLTVEKIGEITYYYVDTTAFFYVEGISMNLGKDTLEASDADEYFTAATASFNEGEWSNGVMVSEPKKTEYNGIEFWQGDIEMEYTGGTKFINSTLISYNDGILTTMSLVGDESNYVIAADEFIEVLKSVQLV